MKIYLDAMGGDNAPQAPAEGAREALERAQEQLRQQLSLREFKMSQASMARALTRLKGSHLKELK